MPAGRPVVRSDGRSYASMADASRDLQRELGLYTSVEHMTSNICAACKGRAHGAYGFGWQYGTEWRGGEWSGERKKAKTMKELRHENESLRSLVRDMLRLFRCGTPEEAREVYSKRRIGPRIAELEVSR